MLAIESCGGTKTFHKASMAYQIRESLEQMARDGRVAVLREDLLSVTYRALWRSAVSHHAISEAA